MSQSQHSLSSWEMSDRMEQPGCRGSNEEGGWLLKVWIWHDAASILCSGALMTIVVPHPSQPHLVDPSHSEVRRSGGGLSFCQLEDELGIVEWPSQGLSQCHLQGSLEFLLCVMVCWDTDSFNPVQPEVARCIAQLCKQWVVSFIW